MITSHANAQIKNIVQLNASSKARTEQGVYLIEGVKMFLEAPSEDIVQVFVSESFYGKTEYRERIEQYAYEVVEDSVFKKASDTMTPQGILCILRQKEYGLTELLSTPKPLLILLEGLQDPGNLGTILRTGEGAGVTGVIMDRNTVDIYNPKVIRATMGSMYRVPFVRVDKLTDILPQLREHKITSYAAHLRGDRTYCEESYEAGCAFLIGNEGNGLSSELSEQADTWIKIPMQGQVESLNAAVSASILMYEVMRQRNSIRCKGESEG